MNASFTVARWQFRRQFHDLVIILHKPILACFCFLSPSEERAIED